MISEQLLYNKVFLALTGLFFSLALEMYLYISTIFASGEAMQYLMLRTMSFTCL